MEKKLQVGVKVLLENKKGEYLLVKRSGEKYPEIPEENRWDIVGGRIDPGIGLLENLQREVYEETQLKLIGTPVLVAAQDIFPPGGGKHVVRLTYTGKTEGNPILDDENVEFKWFSGTALKDFKGLNMFLKDLIDREILEL